MKTKLTVKGMHCKSCETLINDALEEIKGVQRASADNKKGEVVVTHENASMDEVKKAIQKLGYKVTAIS